MGFSLEFGVKILGLGLRGLGVSGLGLGELVDFCLVGIALWGLSFAVSCRFFKLKTVLNTS